MNLKNLKVREFLLPLLMFSSFCLVQASLTSCSRLREDAEAADEKNQKAEVTPAGGQQEPGPVNPPAGPSQSEGSSEQGGQQEILFAGANVVCPENYVKVFNPAPDNSFAFCVAAFEMKIRGKENGDVPYNTDYVADSRPGGTPWVNISRGEAEQECKDLGEDYDLISNEEWQILAHQIEGNNRNWISQAQGQEMMYVGHSDCWAKKPAARNKLSLEGLSVGDIQDYYDQTGNNGSDDVNIGRAQRRTFFLSGEEVIWDLSGNAWEWVKGQVDLKINNEFIEISNLRGLQWVGGELNKEFGPDESYPEKSFWSWGGHYYYGFGYANFAPNWKSIVRGGNSCSRQQAPGVFSVSLSYDPSSYDSSHHGGGYKDVGFRCVKHVKAPEKQ